MFIQILLHTPAWVFGVFALLLWLGLRQAAAGQVPLARMVVLPLVMGAWSIWGVVSSNGAHLAPLAAWLVVATAAAALVLSRPVAAGVRYDPTQRRFHLPGSYVPLALMMGIFLLKYAAGVSFSLHPELRQEPMVAIGTSLLFGTFSGLFAGRAVRLLRLARSQSPSASAGAIGA